jgi:hypothetical protein
VDNIFRQELETRLKMQREFFEQKIADYQEHALAKRKEMEDKIESLEQKLIFQKGKFERKFKEHEGKTDKNIADNIDAINSWVQWAHDVQSVLNEKTGKADVAGINAKIELVQAQMNVLIEAAGQPG